MRYASGRWGSMAARKRILLALFFVVVLVAAACGSDTVVVSGPVVVPSGDVVVEVDEEQLPASQAVEAEAEPADELLELPEDFEVKFNFGGDEGDEG